MKTKDILIVTVLAMLPMSLYAMDNTSTPQEKFSNLDKNNDGYVSREEAIQDQHLSINWTAADSNKDGKLEESEFSAFEEEMAPSSMPMPQGKSE